jgi:hypothetical protein
VTIFKICFVCDWNFKCCFFFHTQVCYAHNCTTRALNSASRCEYKNVTDWLNMRDMQWPVIIYSKVPSVWFRKQVQLCYSPTNPNN